MGLCRKLCLALLMAMPALSQAIEVKQSAPQEYTVKPGDTLWDIASLYLDSPWQWPELWRKNTQILNPHLIYPGDKLTLRRNAQGDVELVMEREQKPKPRFKLGPEGRKQQKAAPIPLLAWKEVAPHLSGVSIVDREAFDALPYLLGDNEGTPRFTNDDWVLSKSVDSSDAEVWVVREQQNLVDAFGESIGVQVRKVAEADVDAREMGNQQLLKVHHARLEARAGDRILTPDPIKPTDFALIPATSEQGQILTTLDQRQLIGRYDTVVINLGDFDTKPGMVFGIYNQGPDIVDGESPEYDEDRVSADLISDRIQQPALKVGELVVVKTYGQASFALVTESSAILKAGAFIANP